MQKSPPESFLPVNLATEGIATAGDSAVIHHVQFLSDDQQRRGFGDAFFGLPADV